MKEDIFEAKRFWIGAKKTLKIRLSRIVQIKSSLYQKPNFNRGSFGLLLV
jgi:hypothetical protein